MGKIYLGTQGGVPFVYDKVEHIGIPRVLDDGVMRIGLPTEGVSISLPSVVTTLGINALYYGFYNNTGITTADLSNITSVPGDYAMYYAFNGCSRLTTVDLSSLVSVTGYYALRYAFSGCTSLTSVDMGGLTTLINSNVMNYAFSGCSSLASFTFTNLSIMSGTQVLAYAFRNCSSLRTLSFPSLTTDSFGNNTNQFNNMLSGCSGVTVHFPSAIQSTIGSWSSVTGGFGGTNTTVLFDL